MAKEIVIDIDENGNCKLEGMGFMGPECEKAMSEIESALGTTTSKVLKPEHSVVVRNKTKLRERA
jgi:uncharacterized protein YuzE